MASLLSPFHIGHRHSYFHVLITMHELLNVPLISGEFGALWKMNKTAAVNPLRLAGAALSGAAQDVSHSIAGESDENMQVYTSDGDKETSDQRMRLGELLHGRSPAYTTDAKGVVPNASLQQHKVVWEHKLETFVRIGVDKERADEGYGALHDTPFRLFVKQSLSESSFDSDSQLGTLRLNLAEYAPRISPVPAPGAPPSVFPGQTRHDTRQYLLSDSASNALVRISVEMRFVGGVAQYAVPEVHCGITGLTTLLEPSDEVANVPDTVANVQDAQWSTMPSHGIDWHSRMPLPQMQLQHAIPPEHIRVPRRERQTRLLSDPEADAPRLKSCATDNDAVVRRVLGMPGEPEDTQREHHAPETQQSLLARLRWGTLKNVISGSSRTVSDSDKRSPPRVRRNSSVRTLSNPLSPLLRSAPDSGGPSSGGNSFATAE